MALKVLVVVDKEQTAIDRMAQGMKPYMTNMDYNVIAVHPKRPDARQLEVFEELAREADIIDWQYFRTAEMLKARYDFLQNIPQMLTHHNPYSITEKDWNTYNLVVANNKSIYKQLGTITNAPVEYLPNTVDTDFWQYNIHWNPTRQVIMVANRIEAKKGIMQVAEACKQLNTRMVLVGSISDREYFMQVMRTGVVDYYDNVTDHKLRDLYYGSMLHVCNSVDNFESGTNPILEALNCGTPVLTRKVGHVPELSNGENMIVHTNQPDDAARLVDLISSALNDRKALEDMREKGWNTGKNRSHQRRAYMLQKLYRSVIYPDQRPVSIVVPIYNRPEVYRKTLEAIAEQTYKNIEVVVADDNPESNEDIVKDFALYVNFPIRYIHTAKFDDDYGLNRARNVATMWATGEVMVYCDERMQMDKEAVQQFVQFTKPRYWLYGNKGAKKEFVENFSSVLRNDVINAGMFSERMTLYGGSSQELRARIRNQGIQTEYVESAKANPIGKSSNRNRKRAEIVAMKNLLFQMGLE